MQSSRNSAIRPAPISTRLKNIIEKNSGQKIREPKTSFIFLPLFMVNIIREKSSYNSTSCSFRFNSFPKGIRRVLTHLTQDCGRNERQPIHIINTAAANRSGMPYLKIKHPAFRLFIVPPVVNAVSIGRRDYHVPYGAWQVIP